MADAKGTLYKMRLRLREFSRFFDKEIIINYKLYAEAKLAKAMKLSLQIQYMLYRTALNKSCSFRRDNIAS